MMALTLLIGLLAGRRRVAAHPGVDAATPPLSGGRWASACPAADLHHHLRFHRMPGPSPINSIASLCYVIAAWR